MQVQQLICLKLSCVRLGMLIFVSFVSGALNTTATSIVVKTQELPPPPKIRDFVDPRITDNTVYETDNNFQRDWLTGKGLAHSQL